MTELAKQVTDLQVKKCDKKDLTQSQTKLQTMINAATAGDLTAKVVNLNSEIQLKTNELR